MKSLTYKFPFLYHYMLKIMHGKNLKKRYNFIADQIEENDFVLDLGCGTGLLADYLKGKRYKGMDINNDFIKFAESKGHNVVNSDIFEFDKYPSSVDVVVLVDMLHHITPKEVELMERLAEMDVKKIIVSEPVSTIQKKSFFYAVAKLIYRIIDDDGHNEMKMRARNSLVLLVMLEAIGVIFIEANNAGLNFIIFAPAYIFCITGFYVIYHALRYSHS